MAQSTGAGPVPLAAAHAAEGLQRLLAVLGAAGQEPERADPAALTADLVAARWRGAPRGDMVAFCRWAWSYR
jgi:hypothetical protein